MKCNLLKEIALHRKLIPAKPAFNILGGTYMTVSEDEIVLRSTDLTTTLVSTFHGHNIKINKKSSFVFFDHRSIKALGNKEIDSIDVDMVNNTVCFNNALVFPVCDSELFPVIPDDFGKVRCVYEDIDTCPVARLTKYQKKTNYMFSDYLYFNRNGDKSEVVFTDSKLVAKCFILHPGCDEKQSVMVHYKAIELLQSSLFNLEVYEKFCVTRDMDLPQGMSRYAISNVPSYSYPNYSYGCNDNNRRKIRFDPKDIQVAIALGTSLRCTHIAMFIKEDGTVNIKLIKYNDVIQSLSTKCSFSEQEPFGDETMFSFTHLVKIFNNRNSTTFDIMLGSNTVLFNVDQAMLMKMKIPEDVLS